MRSESQILVSSSTLYDGFRAVQLAVRLGIIWVTVSGITSFPLRVIVRSEFYCVVHVAIRICSIVSVEWANLMLLCRRWPGIICPNIHMLKGVVRSVSTICNQLSTKLARIRKARGNVLLACSIIRTATSTEAKMMRLREKL